MHQSREENHSILDNELSNFSKISYERDKAINCLNKNYNRYVTSATKHHKDQVKE